MSRFSNMYSNLMVTTLAVTDCVTRITVTCFNKNLGGASRESTVGGKSKYFRVTAYSATLPNSYNNNFLQ